MRLTTWLSPTALACTLALSLSSHAQTPAPAPSPAAAPNARVMEGAAAAYADYQGQVSTIRTRPLAGAEQLDSALNTFGAQNPGQLSSGWLSYQAMVAAQDPAFSAAVRDIDAYYGRDRVMQGMRNDVGYARTLRGGETALQTALLANDQDSGRIASAAAFVKEQAYRLQDVAWGRGRLTNPTATVNRLKASATVTRPVADAATRLFAGPDLGAMLASASTSAQSGQSSIWDRVSTMTAAAPTATLASLTPALTPTGLNAAPAVTQPSRAMRVDPSREGTANRMMTLAAFHVLNAENNHADDVRTAMRDRATHDCIDWSQLQLQACVSAAYTRADLSFCLAEHAIKEPGACFSNLARAP